MKKFNIKLYSIIALFLISSCKDNSKTTSIVDHLPYYEDASFTPIWLNSKVDNLNGLHKIPSFNLINQNGDEITDKTFNNTIYVADFFFTTCPGICSKMTANMALLQEEFRDDKSVMLLSHSVTPEKDSVSVLKSYAQTHNIINDKWHLVTGERKQIYDLGRLAYFVEEDLGEIKSEEDFLHTENFVLIDKNKHIRGIYNGLNKRSISHLINDIKTLKNQEHN